MASSRDEGFEEERFEKEVDRNLKCPICTNVLKNPVQCRRNQHYFCHCCITTHLQRNSPTCPLCQEHLTVETLAQPPRIVTDLLSRLKIRCDHAERGCPELTELEFLDGHVVDCGYSPTPCGNNGCVEIVNKNELENHEGRLCEFRLTNCDVCGEDVVHKKYNTHGCVLKRELEKTKTEMVELKDTVKDQLDTMKVQIQRNHDEAMKEIRRMLVQLKEDVRCTTKKAMEDFRLQTNQLHSRVRDEANNMKAEVKEEVGGMKEAILGMRKFEARRDILVAGGHDGNPRRLNVVEVFRWEKRAWEPAEPMKQRRSVASSFVYENEVFVAGGWTGSEFLCTVEKMSMHLAPKQWLNSHTELPSKCRGHTTAVYQHKLITIGGFNAETTKVSPNVHEVSLSPPVSSKLLSKLPQPRCYHASHIIDDKILIAGGLTGRFNTHCVASVVAYDITKSSWRNLPPLPYPVYGMATVAWEDDVIFLGGAGLDGNAINTVFLYNATTGRNHMLPSMKYKRVGCVAVVTGNAVVVMGGHNDEQGYLNTVEYFSLESYSWEELLPAMLAKRSFPVAVVI